MGEELIKVGYYISFGAVCKLLETPETPEIYQKYVANKDFRKDFRKKYLRNPQFMLKESESESDLGGDFIMRSCNNIKYPWFSFNGFKSYRKYFVEADDDFETEADDDFETEADDDFEFCNEILNFTLIKKNNEYEIYNIDPTINDFSEPLKQNILDFVVNSPNKKYLFEYSKYINVKYPSANHVEYDIHIRLAAEP
jgi:hypothetical protein